MLHLKKGEGWIEMGEAGSRRVKEIAGSRPMEGIHRFSDCSFLVLTSAVSFFSVMNNFVVLLKAS